MHYERSPPFCAPQRYADGRAGLRQFELWARRHKLQDLIQLRLEGGQIELQRQQKAIAKHLELAGGYVITPHFPRAPITSQQGHGTYIALQPVEQDFTTLTQGGL